MFVTRPVAVLAANSRTSLILIHSVPCWILLGLVSDVAFCSLLYLEDDDAGLDVVPLDYESELWSDRLIPHLLLLGHVLLP